MTANLLLGSLASQIRPAAFERIGRLAVLSLYNEVALYPKPGLVSRFDTGSHTDMSMGTFLKSLFALRRYFRDICEAGAQSPGFSELQAMGIAAERRMLGATGGINTHRGAIFSLGLICAAAGKLAALGGPIIAQAICNTVGQMWGDAILESASRDKPRSHGEHVARRFGAGGARAEAAAGFPHVKDASLPAYWETLQATHCSERAAVQALFVLMAQVEDTNLLWRAGTDGARFVQRSAARFLEDGGVLTKDWRARAELLHHIFVSRRLSPGGCADLLAATLLLNALQTDSRLA